MQMGVTIPVAKAPATRLAARVIATAKFLTPTIGFNQQVYTAAMMMMEVTVICNFWASCTKVTIC